MEFLSYSSSAGVSVRAESCPLWAGFFYTYMAKYLVLGGTGFLGTKLVENLHNSGHDITVLARNEGKLVALREEFPNITIIPGDISDSWTVATAFLTKPDGVFLLSAIKGVDTAEMFPYETCKTNVYGVINVIENTFKTKPGFLIFTSTDKTSRVSGVYGATKLLGERLFKEAERINPDTKYRVVKYGNVLYSTGSVLCKWKEKMQNGESVQITDPNMTRFFWTRENALALLFECLESATDSTPYIPSMKAMRMGDLLEAMMLKYGEVPVEIVGNRGGENTHEKLSETIDSETAEKFTIEEISKLI